MDTFNGNFTFREHPPEEEPWPDKLSHSVKECLLELGFGLNSQGIKPPSFNDYRRGFHSGIAVYGKKPGIRKLFGLISYQPLRPFMGDLYVVKNEAMGVSERTWVFDTSCGKDTPNNLLYELEQRFLVRIFFLAGDFYLTSDG
jgi:hypothetical protein